MNTKRFAGSVDARPAGIYTQPDLHQQLKERILAGPTGGQPGEWNAAKARLLAQEYRQAGGGYTFAKRQNPSWTTTDWSSST